ncbi:MAG TPA: AraC family transcriptional regulator [Ruminiclostridium sp.]
MAKSMFFYLKCAGRYFSDSDYYVERKEYNSFLLIYIKSGEGSIYYENKTYEAKENDVVIIACHKPYSYSSDNWETLWVHFDGNMSREFFNTIYASTGCVISLKESIIVPKYLNYIIDDISGNKKTNEPIVSCYIQRILTELMLLSSDTSSEELNNTSPVEEAITYIQNNFKNKISIERLSLDVNLSTFYFSRIFKRETGYSPYEYIIMTRLNEAKKLLKETILSIKEIGFSSGFNSESNFVSCFKNNNYVTPKEFRYTCF